MWSIFFQALGLMFVFEGILPFLSPPRWRKIILQMISQNDQTVRIMGLVSMLIGLALVTIGHDLF